MRSARLLVTYLPTLLLALVLGTIIWATAVREPGPVQNVLIQVPLVPDMTPEQILLNNLPETVQVQIRAKQSILDQLSAGNYSAVVDLASAPYGQTTQLVTLQPPIEGAEEIVLFPEGSTCDSTGKLRVTFPLSSRRRAMLRPVTCAMNSASTRQC